MADNPNGVLAFRDELVSLLKGLDREEQSAARGFFLTAWNGTASYKFDRIIRGKTHIEAACLSLLGSTQPGRLAEYVRRAVSGGAGDDGLIQRFGLLVWPDQSGDWKECDRCPDTAAREAAWRTFDRLESLDVDAIGAERDQFDALPFLRFDDRARGDFGDWRAELEKSVRAADIAPALESHKAKYRKLVPALALINHLADGRTGPIGAEALGRALAFAEYLETHARRAYGCGIAGEAATAKLILSRIRKRDLADGFSAREIQRKGWSGLTDIDAIKAGLELLADLDWIEPAKEETGGKPRVTYAINPTALAVSRYLARLKRLLAEKRPPEELTKLTEGAFVGFVSDQGSRVCGDRARHRRAGRAGRRPCSTPLPRRMGAGESSKAVRRIGSRLAARAGRWRAVPRHMGKRGDGSGMGARRTFRREGRPCLAAQRPASRSHRRGACSIERWLDDAANRNERARVMARWRERVRLEDGLKLDLNKLMRDGLAKSGERRRGIISWSYSATGKAIASGLFTSELSWPLRGWMRLELGSLDQWFNLVTEPRHFGGRQWYFSCPYTGRRASILWKPPGAREFRSRQAWGRCVAYGSQFETWHDRACSAARAARYRLGGAEYADFGGEIPPKPKGMHWRTYEEKIERIEAYENACNSCLLRLIARL